MALVKDINCRQAVGLIGDYLEGKLSRRDRRRLGSAPRGCDACDARTSSRCASPLHSRATVGPEDLSPEALDALLDVFDHFQRENRRTAGMSRRLVE